MNLHFTYISINQEHCCITGKLISSLAEIYCDEMKLILFRPALRRKHCFQLGVLWVSNKSVCVKISPRARVFIYREMFSFYSGLVTWLYFNAFLFICLQFSEWSDHDKEIPDIGKCFQFTFMVVFIVFPNIKIVIRCLIYETFVILFILLSQEFEECSR